MTQEKIVNKTISINAPVAKVWDVLTNPELMKRWISENGTTTVTSGWQVGSPITFAGKWPGNGKEYKDKGTILKFEKEKVFQYNYWSEYSRLPDGPENYLLIEFKLTPKGNQTELVLTQSNFVAEVIFGHWNFYWLVTLDIIKKLVEKHS